MKAKHSLQLLDIYEALLVVVHVDTLLCVTFSFLIDFALLQYMSVSQHLKNLK